MALSALKALSLAINLAHNDPALVKHLADWKDYSWTQVPMSDCNSAVCSVPRQKWDWHRDQWVDFSFERLSHGQIDVTLTLTDNDPADDDFVCVTAAFLDGGQNSIVVFHQNWHVAPGEKVSRRFHLSLLAGTPEPKRVALGSKQCRDGPHEDDDVYRFVLTKLHQRLPEPF